MYASGRETIEDKRIDLTLFKNLKEIIRKYIQRSSKKVYDNFL